MIQTGVEKITAYRTTDGKIFELPSGAKTHQSEIDFYDWYAKNKLYGNVEGSTCRTVDVVEWLVNNEKIISEFLKAFHDRD